MLFIYLLCLHTASYVSELELFSRRINVLIQWTLNVCLAKMQLQ